MDVAAASRMTQCGPSASVYVSVGRAVSIFTAFRRKIRAQGFHPLPS